jgi:hypothetical protein
MWSGTLLSVAFEVEFDIDLDFDLPSQETPRLPHPCAFGAQEPALSPPKGWETRAPAAQAFDVDVFFDSVASGKGTTFSRAESRTTVKDQRFSAP